MLNCWFHFRFMDKVTHHFIYVDYELQQIVLLFHDIKHLMIMATSWNIFIPLNLPIRKNIVVTIWIMLKWFCIILTRYETVLKSSTEHWEPRAGILPHFAIASSYSVLILWVILLICIYVQTVYNNVSTQHTHLQYNLYQQLSRMWFPNISTL